MPFIPASITGSNLSTFAYPLTVAINRKRDGLPTTWSIWGNPRNNGSYVKDKFEFKYIGGINNL